MRRPVRTVIARTHAARTLATRILAARTGASGTGPARRRRVLGLLAATVLLVGLMPASTSASPAADPAPTSPTLAAPSASTVRLAKVADVNAPVLAIGAGDGSGRLFIVEKGGRIRILKNGSVLATPFLDISGSVSKGGEQGLLGLAFHPSFETNRRFYVNFTNTAGDTVVREYKASSANPDRVASGSGRNLLKIDQPYSNHNGGMLAFGRDGFLYIGTGDGGSAGDPGNRAQSLGTLLGKILRIDVNGTTSTKPYRIPRSNPYVGRTGRDEIWQRGLRNPWRFSFDRSNGNLWIGDVGQSTWEEIDRAVRTSTGPGKGVNWGWRVMEGRHCYRPGSGCDTSGKRKPLVEYKHANGRCSVTGGYVYRGSAIAALRGYYVYGDYCTGEVWAVASGASSPATGIRLLDTAASISGFGQDDRGELYLCDLAGDAVYRIVAG